MTDGNANKNMNTTAKLRASGGDGLKAVFLDRDGTINIDHHFVHKSEDFDFMPGVLKGLKLLSDKGFAPVIVTNQSGIARGFFTEADYLKLDAWLKETLRSEGIMIAGSYYCPHLPDAAVERYRVTCECRKPKTGMFMRAVKELGIDLSRSFAVGDRMRDLTICSESECRGCLVGRDSESEETIKAVQDGKYRGLFFAEDMLECAEKICQADTEK